MYLLRFLHNVSHKSDLRTEAAVDAVAAPLLQPGEATGVARVVQFYYGLGFGLQKGLPFLLIPFLVRYYGDHTYASYVLYYSSVQMLAVFASLAVPTSVIVFWYQQLSRPRIITTYLVLMSAILLGLGTITCIPMYFVSKASFDQAGPGALALLSLLFVGQYVANTFLVSLCRATDCSREFFLAQVAGAAALLLTVFALRGAARLTALIVAFITGLLVQNLYLAYGMRGHFRGAALDCFDTGLARRVLRYCLPLLAYNAAVLFVFWVDKYLVRAYFEAPVFSRFVVTFQYAFAQTFLGQVMALYTFPLISRLVAGHDYGRLWQTIRTYNRWIVLLGVLYLLVVLGFHRWIYPLKIGAPGFLLLSCAFLLANLAVNYINVLYAHYRSGRAMTVQLVSAIVMVVVLFGGCITRRIELCYGSHLVMQVVFLVMLVRAARRSRLEADAIPVSGLVECSHAS